MTLRERFTNPLPQSVHDAIALMVANARVEYHGRQVDYFHNEAGDLVLQYTRGTEEWQERAHWWFGDEWYDHFTGNVGAGFVQETFEGRIREGIEEILFTYIKGDMDISDNEWDEAFGDYGTYEMCDTLLEKHLKDSIKVA